MEFTIVFRHLPQDTDIVHIARMLELMAVNLHPDPQLSDDVKVLVPREQLTKEEARRISSLAQPNLRPGWFKEAINRPPKTLEELTEGAYNPFQRERQQNGDKLFTLKLETHVPSKYRVIDLETGDIWQSVNGTWKRAKDIIFNVLGRNKPGSEQGSDEHDVPAPTAGDAG